MPYAPSTLVLAACCGLVVAAAGCRPTPAAPRKDNAPATAGEPAAAAAADPLRRYVDAATGRGLPRTGLLLLVSVGEQRLYALGDAGVEAQYPVSTSRYGIGNREGSNRTPPGMHRVAARFGDGQPVGRVFVGRRPLKRVCPPSAWRAQHSRDLVLTRILHLEGMTPGLNKGKGIDSFRRCIYIHGTNQEQLLGRPASHGCVRMGNRDMLDLFDRCRGRETWCVIMQGRVAAGAPRSAAGSGPRAHR